MVKWEDGELVTPAKVNEDGTIIPAVYKGNTPLSAYNLNKMQNDINNDMAATYKGATITAPTIEGTGRIKKLYGKIEEIGEGEKSPDNPYTIKCVGENGQVEIISKNGENTRFNIINCKRLCCLKDAEGNIIAQDYIDYSKQIVHRECGYIKTYNQEIINTNYISSTGELTAGATIVYKLPEAIEEDINCINGLTQYAEQTEIYNTDGAEIEVELTSNKAISSLNKEISNLQEKNNIHKLDIEELKTKEIDVNTIEFRNNFTLNKTFGSQLIKQQDIVTLNIVINRSENISSNIVAFKLPSNCKPKNHVIISVGLALYGGWAIDNTGYAMIGNDGLVSVRNETGKEYKTMIINATYKAQS